MLKTAFITLLLLIIANAAFIWYGNAQFDATVQTMGRTFVDSNTTYVPQTKAIPPIIEKIIEKSGGKSMYKAIGLQFEGKFRANSTGRWMQMTSLTLLRPDAQMFYSARLKSNFLMTFNAIETYTHHKAYMQTLLWGIIKTGERDGAKFSQSELTKVLAYAPFNPQLFKNNAITYKTIDSRHIQATIKGAGHTATVIFTVNEDKRVIKVTSHDRFRKAGKNFVKNDWQMDIISYKKIDGLSLPQKVRESWIVNHQTVPYTEYDLSSAKRLQ